MNTRISPGLPPLALIAGPTAGGKSALALRLAERTNGIIINADSSQIYNDLQILSARPSEEDTARAPHRLYGACDGATAASAADWAALARTEIAGAHRIRRLPILVGGTGLYLRTLIEGIAPVPPIDPDIRAAVRVLPVAEAHAALTREDAGAAARLQPADTTRVARALEVVRSTGRSIDEWRQERTGGIGDAVWLLPAILLPPRDWIRERCDARFLAMLGAGAIAEVETLLARKLDPALPVMRAIGVRQIAAWLAGEIDRDTMIERAQAATRQYAKRQYTWFTHQPPIDWPRHHTQLDNDQVHKLVIKLHNNALTS